MDDTDHRAYSANADALDPELSQALSIADQAALLRLLIPVEAANDWKNAVQYVRARVREGRNVDVRLLHVVEPVEDGDELRFPTHQVIADQQTEAGELMLRNAATAFASTGATQRSYSRRGDVVFSILDLAEEVDCDAIILPLAPSLWRALGAGRLARTLRRRQRAIPIVTVDRAGRQVDGRSER